VLLDDLGAPEEAPSCLFGMPRVGSASLMAAIDGLNARYGRHTVFPAAMGIERAWTQHAAHRSPRFTTRLGELPVVRV
jgi:DNA polymerase V